MHPEERRIAGLLRELIVQSGAPLDILEKRLGWEPGRLSGLLEGSQRLGFEDLLEILPLLETTPTEFFAWLYGFGAKDSAVAALEEGELAMAAVGSALQKSLDRRFDQSLRVVKSAIARRRTWKEEREKV
jgi:transcriptional regulator with XRE-family HTH domain